MNADLLPQTISGKGDTLSVYRNNGRGYEWYAGRWNDQTQTAGPEETATRYIGTPAAKQASALAVAELTGDRVVVTPWWL